MIRLFNRGHLVSIHAPAEGATLPLCFDLPLKFRFQSTRPRRARLDRRQQD